MTQVAVAERSIDEVGIRRFSLADLEVHGRWMLPRLVRLYPHLNDRALKGWLRALIDSNEHCFLFAQHGVALAQVLSAHTLAPRPIVWERFVWSEDKEHVSDAATFYDHFAKWGRQMGCEVFVVAEMSDVPLDMIKERLGRVSTRQQHFARL